MNKITLHQGHVLAVLRSMPPESVHCVITSPPYWGLRDYGIEVQVWDSGTGVSPVNCEHEWGDELTGKTQSGSLNGSTLEGSPPGKERRPQWLSSFCRLCGAWRGSYGLEPTIDLYVQHSVEIFRELRRVLRPDGVLFLNLGDSYAANRGYQVPDSKHIDAGNSKGMKAADFGLKPKDLCGIPWRVALALQADGWWLRSDIIWSKPNPMPESCTDRPTKTHEYIFLLTKSASYFWDQEGVKENCNSGASDIKKMQESKERIGGIYKDATDPLMAASSKTNVGKKRAVGVPAGRNLRTVWEINDFQGQFLNFCRSRGVDFDEMLREFLQAQELLKDVWNIATESFPSAHFATFSQRLVERCIKAGTSEKGCCPKCGAPWKRVVEKTGHINKREPAHQPNNTPTKTDSTGWAPTTKGTNNWTPTCKCLDSSPLPVSVSPLPPFPKPPVPVPCTVMDPFSGAGTTALVAAKLGRDAIGIELKPEYMAMSANRLRQSLGMLAEVELKGNYTVNSLGEK